MVRNAVYSTDLFDHALGFPVMSHRPSVQILELSNLLQSFVASVMRSSEIEVLFTSTSGWCRFIYAFFAAGAITCFVSLTGHVAAELSNSFCLSCVSYIDVFGVKKP